MSTRDEPRSVPDLLSQILERLRRLEGLQAAAGNFITETTAVGIINHDDLTNVTANQHHTEDHDIIGVHHTAFPGGTTTFLRADGTFAAPSGSSGAIFYKSAAGATISDADFGSPVNGLLGLAYDSTSGKTYLYARANGAWKAVELS